MASYEQLTKYNWKATVSLGYENGKQVKTRKQGFKTKKDAEIWVTDTLGKKHKGYIALTNSNILFKDYINKWFNEYKVLNVSINTKNDYIYRINAHVVPMIGNYKLSELSTSIIQDFYNKLISEKGMKPVSAKKVYDIVNGCLKYAKKSKLIYDLPTDIEKQKLVKPEIEFWTKKEIDFFLDKINDLYLYSPVFLDVLTGLRVGELCGLRWCDVNLESGYIEVNSQVIQDRINKELIFSSILKTSTSHRNISIPPVLIDFLKAMKEDNNALENDFVILSREGLMCNPRNLSMNFTKTVAKYKKSIDDIEKENKEVPKDYMQLKQISFHGLRHTHATLLIFNGENIKVVSDRLGHRDISITLNTYTHIMDDMKSNTATLLNNLFKK
ncbi:site-specific integrase [Clostridium botulinum]|uniref:Site-specific recombinase, phage integrase family n=1 Tax=Clostridium botulinum (strain Eklund 17B / Type B) TaxID=935198 RepID=B2THD3_CLOBB|nr:MULTISPECIES: site-specific integrase [Clostridium]ACD21844.1 site-specific recombinase, phage integrase family [Clostridium botulinum B str. Eklund 17B (NRP)]MBY6977432.1 site-specific integrase [Clostridium botulinum]MBY7001987.1 site-specific integrase [Clostridium botulinum]MCR1275566.1 site-specific integrase [Clostridium botulinum]MCS6131422.1 site-specific integrase [Clostridium botulinum]